MGGCLQHHELLLGLRHGVTLQGDLAHWCIDLYNMATVWDQVIDEPGLTGVLYSERLECLGGEGAEERCYLADILPQPFCILLMILFFSILAPI